MRPAISPWASFDAAIAKYQHCVRLDPEYFDAWHALGMALMKAGRFPEAIGRGPAGCRIESQRSTRVVQPFDLLVKNGQVPEAEAAGAKARILSWGGKSKKVRQEREVFYQQRRLITRTLRRTSDMRMRRSSLTSSPAITG